MPRTPEENRAYQREYRAKRKTAPPDRMTELVAENVRLVEEVRVLKQELAKRPARSTALVLPDIFAEHPYNTRPFTPVPKKGK